MEINDLIAEAEKSLRDADPLCVDANAFYAELRLLVEQSTVLWARILFLRAAQQDQLQSMGNVCIVIKNGVENARLECKQRVKTMKRGRSDLHNELSALKQTNVDRSFLGNSTLYEYVHEHDILTLESQVDSLIEQLQVYISELEGLPGQVQQQLGELRSRSPQPQTVIESAIPRKMAKMTAKAAPYANDMADLLTSLTSHYDLCSQIPQLNADEASEALIVAMGDRDQVTNALERLHECRNQLRHKHKESQRLQHSLAMSFEHLKGFEDDISVFISQKLRPVLTKVSDKHAECQNLFVRVEAITNELSSLTEYYRLFRKSYHALVIEVCRRQESAKQLRKVVEKANTALKGFHSREIDARNTFLDAYREFLPPELWPSMVEMPQGYEINLEEEELPMLSKSTQLNALKEDEQ